MNNKSSIKKIFVAIILFTISNTISAQLSPLTVGTINPGDSIVIYYDVTINSSLPGSVTRIANRGTITGTGISVLTDDPDTAPDDSTYTYLNLWPLPVTLYNLNATQKNGGIEIVWNTASEYDMVKYEVERSIDGRSFAKIGEVASLNRATGYTYSFFDPSPNAGMNFYRLRLIDRAAVAAYSYIVRVDLNGKNGSINIYPNPVTQKQFTLQLINIAKGTYKLVFYNSIGQPIYTSGINHGGGSMTAKINLVATMGAGVYHVQLQTDRVLYHQWLMVK